MLAKVLSLLATTKGATATVVLVTVAAGSTVVATNPDVQNAVQQTITQSSPKPTECETKSPESGKPVVVSMRNAANATLRDTFQKDQRALEALRSNRYEGADRQKLEDAVKAADAKLHARYQNALDEVAALTLGRGGHDDASASPDADSSPKAKSSPDADSSPKAKSSPDADGSPKAATTDCAKTAAPAASDAKLGIDGVHKLDAVVTSAKNDMDTIVKDAQKAVPAPAPSPSHGRSSEAPSSPRP